MDILPFFSSIYSYISGQEVMLTIALFVFVVLAMIFEFIDKVLAMMLSIFFLFVFSVVHPSELIEMIDFNTIFLLIGMMIVVSITIESRLISLVNIKVVQFTKGDPLFLFILFSLVTFSLSLLLSNAATMMILVPLTIGITKSMGIDPKPYLISEIIFSDIGGAMTYIGDPTNILIGSANNFTFNDFIENLSLPILSITVLVLGILTWKYWDLVQPIRKSIPKLFMNTLSLKKIEEEFKNTNLNIPFIKIVSISLLVIIGGLIVDFMDLPISYIAFFGGVFLLLFTRKHISPHEVFHMVDWHMILFFIGLFIHIGVLEKVGALEPLTHILSSNITTAFGLSMIIMWTVGLLSGFIENIPLVAMMIPILQPLLASGDISGNTTMVWYALSMGACLGGNGSLIGSSANMIVAQTAEKMGIKITFWEYFKVGYPITVFSLSISSVYLYFVT